MFNPIPAGIHIRQEEVNLFRYLYENRVATATQIHRDVYPNFIQRSVNNRLHLLIKKNYITANYYSGLGRRLIFSLAPSGFRDYLKPFGEKLIKHLGSDSVFHDLKLVEIRTLLERSKRVKSYQTENVIASDRLSQQADEFWLGNIKPDALVEIELAEDTFLLPLEYESAQKYRDRYRLLFRKYYSNTSIAGVLYICENDYLLHYIRTIEKSEIHQHRPKFYYSDFSKWKPANLKMFVNLEGTRIAI